jgi:hypothetical protein
MSTVELKERLIEKIKATDNENILEEAYRLLDMETADMGVYHFSEEERNEIKASKNQISNGQSLTNEAANKEIDQWLNK